MRRLSSIIIVTVAIVGGLLLIGTSTSSGPSEDAAAASVRPPTTTTTEPPPEGVAIVKITGGAFRPSNLDIKLEETPVVQWRHEEPLPYALQGILVLIGAHNFQNAWADCRGSPSDLGIALARLQASQEI